MLTTPQHQKEEFVQLLRLTLVPDNQQRKLSEDKLNSIDNLVKAKLLLDVLITEKDVQVIQAAALMLRRLIIQIKIVAPEHIPCLNDIKLAVPGLCLKETNSSVRNKLVDIFTELVRLANSESSFVFNEAAKFLYECIKSNEEIGKLTAFRILQSSSTISSQFNDDHVSEIYKSIVETMSLDQVKHKNLIIEAAKAFVNFSIYLPKTRLKNVIATPFQVFLRVIKSIDDSETGLELLEELDDMIESCSDIVIPFIPTIVELVLEMLSSQHTSEPLRIGAMECLVLLAENRRKYFQEMCSSYFDNIVEILLRHMTVLEEDPKWAYTLIDDEDDDEQNELASEAESTLDRLAVVVSSKTFFHIIKDKVSILLGSKVWQHRYAALSAISCIAEGTRKTMKQFLPSIIDTICPFMRDEHPRVVYACITCIGQLSTDFSDYFVTNFHEKVYPLMFIASEFYTAFPRLQARAVCCFVNLIDACPKRFLEVYADKFFHYSRSAFIRSVNDIGNPGVPMVLENSLVAISKLAESLESAFSKYYSSIVPELIALLRSLSSTHHTKYYIQALDTLANILMAVQKDVCRQDLVPIMEILKRFEISAIKKDDNRDYQLEYLEILVYMANVFGEEFSPVIPHLLPTLFELTSTTIDNPLVTSPWAIIDEISGGPSLQKVFSAHTDAVEDRSRALSIVNKLFKLMKGSMVAHVDTMCEIAVKNFTEIFDDGVQYACLQLFSSLLKSAAAYQAEYMLSLWIKIFNVFYQRVLGKNPLFDHDRAFDGVERCLRVVSLQGLNDEILLKLTEMINFEISTIVGDYGNQVPNDISDDIISSNLEESDEPDSEEEDMDDDDPCDRAFCAINDLMRYLMKLAGPKMLRLWENINSNVIIMSECANPTIRGYSILMYCHVFQYMPSESVNLSSGILGNIAKALEDNNTHVRSSAIHCVGVVSEYAANCHKKFLEFSLSILVKLICSCPSSEMDSRDAIVDRAISSVGKIMKFSPEIIIAFDTAVQTWISWLPIDEEDVDFVLEYLIELIETKFQVVSGPGNSHLHKVLDSIVYMMPYAKPTVNSRSLKILKLIQNHVPDLFNAWFEALSDNAKQTIESARSLCDDINN